MSKKCRDCHYAMPITDTFGLIHCQAPSPQWMDTICEAICPGDDIIAPNTDADCCESFRVATAAPEVIEDE